MALPEFKYHPDPIATGAVVQSPEKCACCGQARGYVCTSTIYAEEDVEYICPWCVADGSAAKKFEGTFVDDYPLIEAGLDEIIIKEVCERTPCYISWQQEHWETHCNDACEFHGDADIEDLKKLEGAALEKLLKENYYSQDEWKELLTCYKKGGDPAIYKFKCRKCGEVTFNMDLS